MSLLKPHKSIESKLIRTFGVNFQNQKESKTFELHKNEGLNEAELVS